MNHTLPAPLDVKLMNLTASVLFAGCVVLVLAASAWWVLRHPAFGIGRIVVQGDLVHNNAVTLRANVAPHLAGNFFTLNLHAARAAFEQMPWVRSAQVRREYPGTLQVVLQEHRAVASWGDEGDTAMLNRQGEVFDANADDAEYEGLPRLKGPPGQSALVLQMHDQLQSMFGPLGMVVQGLELTGRGSWRMVLDSGAEVELGGGSVVDVLLRTQRFVRTLTQVTAQYGRRADALESADLRHGGGYALRLRGVTTVTVGQTAPARR
jgi:cell division protein FtsQ